MIILVHKDDYLEEHHKGKLPTSVDNFFIVKYNEEKNVPAYLKQHKRYTKEQLIETRKRLAAGETISEKKPPVIKNSAFVDPQGKRARFKGMHVGQVSSIGEHTFDYVFAEDRYITGVEVFVNNPAFGDNIDFDIIHPVSAESIDDFAANWYVSPGKQIYEVYPAKIPAGLIIRVTYRATSANVVEFYINGFLHKP
jgi:hypothetical protein